MLDALLSSPIVSIIKSALAFIITLGILITVHEFGHFWVARRCGVKIIRFSVGFGKALWRRTDRYGTEFVIAMIPLGGYVKMLDKQPEKNNEETSPVAELDKNEKISTEVKNNNQTDVRRYTAYRDTPIWKRMAIVIAGPLANVLFVIVAYWLLFLYGVPGIMPVVDEVKSGSVAAHAGLKPGMRIDSVNGSRVDSLESLELILISVQNSSKLDMQLTDMNTQEQTQISIDTQNWRYNPEKDGRVLSSLGIKPRLPKRSLTIRAVRENSAADKAGMKINDRVVKVNGVTLHSGDELYRVVQNNPGVSLELEVDRQGQKMFLHAVPDAFNLDNGKAIGQLGITLAAVPLAKSYYIKTRYNPIDAAITATKQTGFLCKAMIVEFAKLLTGHRSLKELSGPIAIAQVVGAAAERGLVDYVSFLALISINLAIINLFPLPVLDGGQLLFLWIEALKGKPVSEKVMNYFYFIGIICLVLLMGLTLFNDLSRI